MRILVAALVGFASLWTGSAFGQSLYAGSYSGTFTGSDRGTWQLTIDDLGNAAGTVHSTLDGESYTASGSVSAGGVAVVGVVTGGDTSFSGTINSTGRLSGTWTSTDGGGVETGTFTGQRAAVQLTVVNGAGSGKYVSGKSVTIQAKTIAGMRFSSWSDGSTNAARVIVMPTTNATYAASFVDVQKPTVAIAAPTAGLKIKGTNALFTVKGTAADNVAVRSVWVQVNGGAWAKAVATNAWSSAVTLVRQANTVCAYSEDFAGNCSATAKVACVWAETSPITVSVAGKGTVAPNYGGQLLEIGQSYTMKATAGSGFVFQSWTRAAEDVVSSLSSLTFTMASNLVLQANFGDVQKPLVAFTSPASAAVQRIVSTSGVFDVKGTASDNWAVSSVRVQVNDGDWTNAVGTSVWSSSTALAAGTNVIRACSWDVAGNASVTATVRCVFVPTLPPFAYGGHIYVLVSAEKTSWTQAKAAASAATYRASVVGRCGEPAWEVALEGAKGHLAVIETPEENAAIFAALDPAANPCMDLILPRDGYAHPDSGARGVWLGGSDSKAAVVSASEGNFYWVPYGVVAAQNFWTNGTSGRAASGVFANFGEGEPDNWCDADSGRQDHVALQLDAWPLGLAGQWNDLDGAKSQAYLIEYENSAETLAALKAEGLEAWSAFADQNTVPRGDSQWLALAAADFDLVSRSAPKDYTNRIYNALAILVELANNETLRSQAEAYGVTDWSDLFAIGAAPHFSGAPVANDSVDVLCAVLLPKIDQALTELNAIPTTWAGNVAVSPDQFPIDEAVWVDLGDVASLKAALRGARAVIGLAGSYDVNVDFGRLVDPLVTPTNTISVDGVSEDWGGAACSLQSVRYPGLGEDPAAVTQTVSVALNDGRAVLLVTGCNSFLKGEAGSSYALSFELRLSDTNSPAESRATAIELYTDLAKSCWIYRDGEYLGEQGLVSFNTESRNGTLELSVPLPADDKIAVNQITVRKVACCDGFSEGTELCALSFPDDVPLQVWRAAQPSVFSAVRNATRLGAVKADLQAALNGYLSADTLVAGRTGENALLPHIVDYDPSDEEAAAERADRRSTVSSILTSLSAAIQIEADEDIEGVETRPVCLGAFFKAPYVTADALPYNLGGTMRDPAWTAFPNPTFNGMLPSMASDVLTKYLLGCTEVQVMTRDDPDGLCLAYWARSYRDSKTINGVTVFSSGTNGLPLAQWTRNTNAWVGCVGVASKVAAGKAYTFGVTYTDGTSETLTDSIKRWVSFFPKLNGNMLSWAAVAVADHYTVDVWSGDSCWQTFNLPSTQTSLNLSTLGLEAGRSYSIELYVYDTKDDRVGRRFSYQP